MSQPDILARPVMSRKSGPLQGSIAIPGDKSISHRSLIFGALATGQTKITGLLEGEDIFATIHALQAMGVSIEKSDGVWRVLGAGLGGFIEPQRDLDFGNAGTGSRLMMGAVAGHAMRATFTGDASLKRRPMGRILDPLREMGLDVLEKDRTTFPLTLIGTDRLIPITYRLPVPSAQVKSAVLIAGLLAPGTTTVIEPEKTRDHTEKMLSYFGACIETRENDDNVRYIILQGQPLLKGQPVVVPGDPSSAAFLAAAALLCEGSDVTIRNVLINPTRTGFYKTVKEMGADLSFVNERQESGELIADVHVRSSRLHGVHVPAERAPTMIDEYPILAIVSSFAQGETVMEGLGELKVKESDRLAVTVAGLIANGIEARAEGDTLRVKGASKVRGGGTIATHLDHRIAMSFLVLGLNTEQPVTIDDISVVSTSFPQFCELLSSIGGKIEQVEP